MAWGGLWIVSVVGKASRTREVLQVSNMDASPNLYLSSFIDSPNLLLLVETIYIPDDKVHDISQGYKYSTTILL